MLDISGWDRQSRSCQKCFRLSATCFGVSEWLTVTHQRFVSLIRVSDNIYHLED